MAEQITINEGACGLVAPGSQIAISVVEESVHLLVAESSVQVAFHEERLEVSTTAALWGPIWPFGGNPTRVLSIPRELATDLDSVRMPSLYRVVKWLLLLEDAGREFAITSEIKAFWRNGHVLFTEYGIIGDTDRLRYEIDVVAEGDTVRLVMTSHYDGMLDARILRLGILN